MSEFGLTLPEIMALTPRQIADVYFHPRDKDGAIQAPEGPAGIPMDLPARLAQLLAMAPGLGLPADQVAELKRRLEAARANA